MTRRKIIATENFERNLDGLEAFRTEHPQGFLRALERLSGEVKPLLAKQPNVGRLSMHGALQPIVEHIQLRLGGGVLRELPLNEYVILYLVGEKQLWMLSIRHHRELDFDFGD